MKNARTELLNFLKALSGVKCAELSFSNWRMSTNKELKLKIGYSLSDWGAFLDGLDKEYDSGYGGQELSGTLWMTDGTWCTRGEYDGSEWWEHNVIPEIPKHLL